MPGHILVAYYSRTGNTKTIAEQIAAGLGADLEVITDRTPRSGPLGYLRSGFDAFFHRPAEIGPAVHDPTAYDLVIVGTPIWNASLSSPVRSYLEGHRPAMPAVAFFCTCGGLGSERVFAQMARVCGKQPAATLVVRENEIRSASTAIERFAAEINETVARRVLGVGAERQGLMLDLIKKHFADYSASKWNDYKALLAADATYEEMATRQRVKGADEYVNTVKRWKTAFPDLKATVTAGFVSGDNVVVEVEWEGTHSGSFDGPFGSIPATNKRGRVNAMLMFTFKNGKIIQSRHYFDLLTVLTQIGVAPMAAIAQPAKAGAPAPRH